MTTITMIIHWSSMMMMIRMICIVLLWINIFILLVGGQGQEQQREQQDCPGTTSTTTATVPNEECQQDNKNDKNAYIVIENAKNNANKNANVPHLPRRQPSSSSFSSFRWIPQAKHPCTITRMTLDEVFQRFGPNGLPPLYSYPLVITNTTNNMTTNNYNNYNNKKKKKNSNIRNEVFRNKTHMNHILKEFPSNFQVTLTSSNSFSEHRRQIPLQQYIKEQLIGVGDGVGYKNQGGETTTVVAGDDVDGLHKNDNVGVDVGVGVGETHPDQLSNETWYLFGETFTYHWKQLLKWYELPPCQACNCCPNDDDDDDDDDSAADHNNNDLIALSFGIGNRGSGVQWHVHGPGYSEAIHGRKHWILYPPNYQKIYQQYYQQKQQQEQKQSLTNSSSSSSNTTTLLPHAQNNNEKSFFHPDQTSRNWMEYTYTTLSPYKKNQEEEDEVEVEEDPKSKTSHQQQQKQQQEQQQSFQRQRQRQRQRNHILRQPMECTLDPGDIIYFPDMWWHATINLDPYTAFVSTFIQEHLYVKQQHEQQKQKEQLGVSYGIGWDL